MKSEYSTLIEISKNLAILDEKDRVLRHSVAECITKTWIVGIQSPHGTWQWRGYSKSQLLRGVLAYIFSDIEGKATHEILEIITDKTYSFTIPPLVSNNRIAGVHGILKKIHNIVNEK